MQFQPGRVLGVITRTDTREKGFVFVQDAQGREYFAHRSAFNDPATFEGVVTGDGMNFRAAKGPKGMRAFDINRAVDEELTVIAEWEEDRGNR